MHGGFGGGEAAVDDGADEDFFESFGHKGAGGAAAAVGELLNVSRISMLYSVVWKGNSERRGETNQNDVFGEERWVTAHRRGEVDHCLGIASDEAGEIVAKISFDGAVNVFCALEFGFAIAVTFRVASEVEAGDRTSQIRVKEFESGRGAEIRSCIRRVVWKKLTEASVRGSTCARFEGDLYLFGDIISKANGTSAVSCHVNDDLCDTLGFE